MSHEHQEAFVVAFAVVMALGLVWFIRWSGRQR